MNDGHNCWLPFLNIELRAIAAHRSQRQKIPLRIDGPGGGLDKHIGMNFPRRLLRVAAQEKFGYRRGNRSVIEDPVHDGILRDPRGNKNRRNPHPESIELKLHPGPGAVR